MSARATVGGGTYGVVWDGSINEGRVDETATPTAVFITSGSSGPLLHPTFATPLPPSYEERAKKVRLRRVF